MAYYHVEDTTPKAGSFTGRVGKGILGSKRVSNTTIAHSVWRCGHCRALAVTKLGDKPPAKCGKCAC